MALKGVGWPSGQIRGLSCCLIISLCVQLGSSIQLYTEATLPTGLSSGCQTALIADVAQCSLTATKFRYGYFYPESTLMATCTAQCTSALQSFETSVISSCTDDTWDGYDDGGMPVAFIPSVLRYLYELTCLQDGDRFCNVVAGTNAAIADPGGELANSQAFLSKPWR
jgi:hypothetical protein